VEDLKAVDVNWNEAEAIAADRQQWRTIAAQCAARRKRK